MPLRPLIPDKNASVRAAVRAVDSKVRPDFRRAIVCAVLAFTLDGATPYFGGVHAATLDRRLAAYGTAAGFVVFGLAATRSVASELSRVSLSRAGAAAATPLRVGCLLVGYLIVALTAMDLFALPVGNLLVGGAGGGQPEDDEPGGRAVRRQAPIQCCRVHTAEVGAGPVQGEGEDRAHYRAAEVGADLRVDGTYRGPYRSVPVRDQWSQRHQPCLSTSRATRPIDPVGLSQIRHVRSNNSWEVDPLIVSYLSAALR